MRRLAAFALLFAAACGVEGSPAPLPDATTYPTAAPAHDAPRRFAIVVLENHEYDQIIGNPQAPFLNRFAHENALATNFFAITHPSLPNYLALLGGDTFGVTSNCASCHFAQRNLVDQLESAGISWKAYMQGVPGPCYRHEGGSNYLRRHNPFSYFDSIDADTARCNNVVPLTDFDRDIAAGTVPRLVWITPDGCNDMHDCGVETGDAFLFALVPKLLSALGPHGVLFLTFDEGTTNRSCCEKAHGGRIATIVAGPDVNPGRYDQPLDHYSILRTIEDGFGLPRLATAACPCTPSMEALFRPT